MSAPETEASEYMSVREVATALRLSLPSVYRMCSAGQLAHIRTGPNGRAYRILRSSYEQHITPAPVPTPDPTIPGDQMIPGLDD